MMQLKHRCQTCAISRLVVIVVVVAFAVRLGYGVCRYKRQLLLSDNAFITIWHHDALYHVLIAKGILEKHEYVVSPPPSGPVLRYQGEPALFKAPAYQYFLAGIFKLSGFSFAFFPLQALAGSLMCGIVALIANRAFQNPIAAYYAGLTAAVHPILVNSASQPYNENVFFFLFMVSIWAFVLWTEQNKPALAVLSGLSMGLCALTRESGLLICAGFVAALMQKSLVINRKRAAFGLAIVLGSASVVVFPWVIGNHLKYHTGLLISGISGPDFVDGNNECLVKESALLPYSAEHGCPPLRTELSFRLHHYEFDRTIPTAIRVHLVCVQMAKEFLRENFSGYGKLVFRRLWTTLLPFSPRGPQGWYERIALSFYWIAVFPLGFVGIVIQARKGFDSIHALLLSILLIYVAAIAAVLYWSDLRFRLGSDLILGCFAGSALVSALEKSKSHCLLPPVMPLVTKCFHGTHHSCSLQESPKTIGPAARHPQDGPG